MTDDEKDWVKTQAAELCDSFQQVQNYWQKDLKSCEQWQKSCEYKMAAMRLLLQLPLDDETKMFIESHIVKMEEDWFTLSRYTEEVS